MISIEENQNLLHKIPLEDVRNFCFIAHVDHGKSSLSSRILEITGNMGRDNQITALQTARGEDSENNNEQQSQQLQSKVSEQKEQINLLYDTAESSVLLKLF